MTISTREQFEAQARVRRNRERRAAAIRRADEALKTALKEAFPGVLVDKNRVDAVTAVLTAMGHDVIATSNHRG